ncbi:GFA family protein [Pseudomonas alliivorans]|nr:GFA family protein [Pseudomonas alliivorans]MEE4776725.1 GFA family protein [Pseudomonas alliivorans]
MIKSVGPTEIKPTHLASCHCGAVVLELDLPDGIVDPRRCDCSLCRRRGSIVATVAEDGVRVIHGQKMLKLYQFNSRTAEHYFCGRCGIYTHHRRRSNPHEFGYNVACLDGVNPFDLGPVQTSDGVNHPADRPAGPLPLCD